MEKFLTVALISAGSFIAGVLFAPKSGKETRQDLMDKGAEYRSKAQAGVEAAKKGAADVKDELAESAKVVKREVQETTRETRAAASR